MINVIEINYFGIFDSLLTRIVYEYLIHAYIYTTEYIIINQVFVHFHHHYYRMEVNVAYFNIIILAHTALSKLKFHRYILHVNSNEHIEYS